MINMEKYEKLLNEGLGLDHFYVLSTLYNGQKLCAHPRVQGFANALLKRGYILEGGLLTEKGIDIVQEDILMDIVSTSTTSTTTISPEVSSFNDWVFALHRRLEERLVELTGKKQVRDKIKNGPLQSFLCNPQDLGHNIKRVMTKYRLSDRKVIESALMKHIDNCQKANNWFPLMYYYIMKEGASKMVTDLSTASEIEESFNSETFI